MPETAGVVIAQPRQLSRTAQPWQTRLAALTWFTAGPVVPTGKNSSGSACRHAASSRQLASWVIAVLLRLVCNFTPVMATVASHVQGESLSAGRVDFPS
jgi:hypothetical protein